MSARLHPITALTFTALACAMSSALHAQQAPPPTASEWGGIGLLQTPTARMAESGDLSFTASNNSPYSRYNLTMQPFEWLEGSFRYINVANLRYGAVNVSGDQKYKDKSIDLKLRLWQESRMLPEVAFGIRDLGGTGFFSSEYLVASKRFGPFDANIGLATGYIGNRGDFGSPLAFIDDRFKTRPIGRSDINNAGNFGANQMFRGRVGIFGGVAYQTPWEPLQVKLEYDGNDYKREPRGNNLEQKTPLNIGVVYSVNRNVQITAAWERGDAAMFALTLRGNPGQAVSAPKPFNPPPEQIRDWSVAPATPAGNGSAPHTETAQVTNAAVPPSDNLSPATPQAAQPSIPEDADWLAITNRLRSNAGFRVDEVSVRGTELFVSGHQLRHYYGSEGIGRAARILHNAIDPSIEWFTIVSTRLGMPIVQTSINRRTFVDYLDGRIDLDGMKLGVEMSEPDILLREPLYKRELVPYGGGFNIGYRQNLGGPDGFILYQVSANYSGSYFFTQNLWLTGTASANLLNNYDKFKYNAPSRMQRVRTDLRQYMTTSDVTLPNLQLSVAGKLGRDLYGIAYAGYLEWMYAGVGGEILYRPIGESWAVGANLNHVRQRDYDQHFGLRDYSVTTGHATLYYAFDQQERIVGSISAGRYLAGDIGATVNLARVFNNGVAMGAYATKTNVSSREFGEGSFDKGIYFSIPFDMVLPRSTRASAALNWNPLVRDGGAMMGRKYPLYNITGERDSRFFYDNLRKLKD